MQIYRVLMHGRPRLRPWEIERLTLPELELALDQDLEEQRPPPGGQALSAGDIQAYADWWRSLTPWQRLERAAARS